MPGGADSGRRGQEAVRQRTRAHMVEDKSTYGRGQEHVRPRTRARTAVWMLKFCQAFMAPKKRFLCFACQKNSGALYLKSNYQYARLITLSDPGGVCFREFAYFIRLGKPVSRSGRRMISRVYLFHTPRQSCFQIRAAYVFGSLLISYASPGKSSDMAGECAG